MSLMEKESVDNGSNARIRTIVLVLLCVQNASQVLLTKYSRGVLHENYSFTEVIVVSELIKLVASGYFAMVDRSDTDAEGTGLMKIKWLITHSRQVVVLVVLYALANILSYFVVARIDASAYSVLVQLKILTTACFSVWMFGRNFSNAKWRALFLLVIGCILVASPAYNHPQCLPAEGAGTSSQPSIVNVEAITPEFGVMAVAMGYGAVLLMDVSSGFSAVYFESIMKTGVKVTIWERNFQLAFLSIWVLAFVLAWEKYHEPSVTFLQGWTVTTWVVAIFGAAGGLLVAATLKYADAVVKTLATSGSIVISAILGHVLLGGELDVIIGLGCVATILAICNYTFE